MTLLARIQSQGPPHPCLLHHASVAISRRTKSAPISLTSIDRIVIIIPVLHTNLTITCHATRLKSTLYTGEGSTRYQISPDMCDVEFGSILLDSRHITSRKQLPHSTIHPPVPIPVDISRLPNLRAPGKRQFILNSLIRPVPPSSH
jgi:hypothetical protein